MSNGTTTRKTKTCNNLKKLLNLVANSSKNEEAYLSISNLICSNLKYVQVVLTVRQSTTMKKIPNHFTNIARFIAKARKIVFL